MEENKDPFAHAPVEAILAKDLGVKPPKRVADCTYDDFLEYFRRVPTASLVRFKDELEALLPVEGFAAVSRWLEIVDDPSKMDKLYQGRLKAESRESIMDLAVGDDDVAFYEALIRETVTKLDESRNSAQEVARLTQNLNIFRAALRDARSRTPKKGSVLEKVLLASSKPPKAPQKRSKKATGTKKKTTVKKKGKNESVPNPKN